MTITNLNTFTAGTVASVTPMNENFETIRIEVNSIEQTVSENRTYLDNKVVEINENIEESIKEVKTTGTLFCVNEGPLNSGIPEILTVSGTTLSFATPFVITNSEGTSAKITTMPDESISGYADGQYNVFLGTDKTVEILANTIYKQAVAPVGVLGDVWVNTSKTPLDVKKYTSEGWKPFLKVQIGSFEISSGSVQNVKTNAYNQNGYNLNIESGFPMPDFSKGISKTNNIEYTAECAGWIRAYFLGTVSSSYGTLTINGEAHFVGSIQFVGSGFAIGCGNYFPIPKGTVYKGNSLTHFDFYPAIIN